MGNGIRSMTAFAAIFLGSITANSQEVDSCGTNVACKIFRNLTSVNPLPSDLAAIRAEMEKSKDDVAAAMWIIDNAKEFWMVQVKQFAEPWSEQDGKLGAKLDETSATIIAAIKQDINFGRILWDDLIAVGQGELYGQNDDQMKLKDGGIVPRYLKGVNSANHYQALEKLENYWQDGILALISQIPTTFPANQPAAPSGILTTAGFGEAALSAGTNRRAIPMITREALCLDIEDLRDQTGPETYIKRDVVRQDSDGTTTTYKTVCKTCHSGPLEQWVNAFLFYDFQNAAVVYKHFDMLNDAERASHLADHKMLRSASSVGFIPKNDEWFLELTAGQRRLVGPPEGRAEGGFGLESLGKFVASTQSFAKCQPQKAFKAVCGHLPRPTDREFIQKLIIEFVDSGYKMKNMFAKSAVYCAGGRL